MLLVLSATSCGEWLNLSPEDGVTREDFWQSKEQVESAVIGIYCEMMNTECVNRMFLWGELRADMVIDGTKPNAAYTAIRSGEIASDNAVCKWSDFYSVINNCNLVLEYADQAVELDASYSQQEADLFKAEAKALRAMMYFYLTRSFGDVPMVLEASVSDDQDYHIAKTSQDSILDQIILDLTEAERVMETNNPAYNMEFPKGRMTVWAVKALLADAYLWKGKYDAAIQRCDAIINSEEFVLISVPRTALPGVENLYFSDVTAIDLMFNKVWATGNSEESIFELNFDETKTNGFYNLFASARNVLVANVDYIEGNYFPLYELDESVYDVRSNGYSYQGTIIWKYMALTRQGTARTSQQSYANWIFYRYPEILLMKAEALIQKGTQADLQAAYALIMQVRSRANALESDETDFSGIINADELEQFLLDERARELMFEGKRWYDVLRFARRNNYAKIDYLMDLALNSAPTGKQQSLQSKYGDHRSHYWPIHDDELKSNQSLVQNTFYETSTTIKK